MFWKWFWKAFAFLFILSIFVGGGILIYRAGVMHGATNGLLSVEPGSGSPIPYQRFYPRPLILLPFTGMFFLFLLVVLFGGARRHTHYRLWKSAGKPHPDEFRRHWNKYHHSHPPHPCWGSEEPDRDPSNNNVESDDEERDTNSESQ